MQKIILVQYFSLKNVNYLMNSTWYTYKLNYDITLKKTLF